MLEKSNLARRNGFLVIDSFKETEKFKKGLKKKRWLTDGVGSYMFKEGTVNYEIWSALLSTEIGKQLDMEFAEYDLAVFNGAQGLITKDFLKKDETIISGDNILSFYYNILEENNKLKDVGNLNSIENIYSAVCLLFPDECSPNFFYSLIKLWAFDGLFMESDRNRSNWAIIKSTDSFRLSPIYDTSTISRANNNIDELLAGTKSYLDIAAMTDPIICQLTYKKTNETNKFLDSFEEFCNELPNAADAIMVLLNKIDIHKAIENVEKRINGEMSVDDESYISFPIKYAIWLDKTVNFRLLDMNRIYKKSKSDKDEIDYKKH